ncbi:MAG: aspartate carbamoyltransferase [Gammaproteobacteria bacterium]|nr:aspartate carbamoyltransferase [Gammaproteobacteria bacterium]
MSENSLYQRNIVTTKELSLDDVNLVFATAQKFKQQKHGNQLQNKIIASCFFEPSTRTRLSFESSTIRLGGKVVGFTSDEALSVQKGETLYDTMRVISSYADLIVIRHSQEGAAALAEQAASCPIINAGDGANQHPTQALLDLFTIQECQQHIDGLSIALVGDLKYGRTIHSLTQLCALFDIRLYLVSPETLTLPESVSDLLKKKGIRFSFHDDLKEVIPKVDVLYFTRIQQERFGAAEYQLVKNQFILTSDMLSKAKPNLKILHPLPRVNEIAPDVDNTPYAYYFQQAANGLPVRQALLSLILNESLP